jgi:hypothetical protein
MAGTHHFVVPDEEHAQRLAEALSGYGFALVTGRQWSNGEWRVVAYDAGPYPIGANGHHAMDTVQRGAAAVARQHAGYPAGGTRCVAAGLNTEDASHAPIVRTNPGARPPVSTVRVAAPPPAPPLALTPDRADDVPIDLSGLDAIPWADLSHARGRADDVPHLLRALADPKGDWDQILETLLGDNLLHQDTCYSATAPAMPFLARMIRSGALPARQRLELYVWSLIAATRLADSLLADADRAAALGDSPVPEAWTAQVHHAVESQLPELLARWAVEPPAARFLLACLSGVYPHHGWQLADQIAALAEEFDGTQPGFYLRLAQALVNHDSHRVGTIAADIISWDSHLSLHWIDAVGVPIAVKAARILVEGALQVFVSSC